MYPVYVTYQVCVCVRMYFLERGLWSQWCCQKHSNTTVSVNPEELLLDWVFLFCLNLGQSDTKPQGYVNVNKTLSGILMISCAANCEQRKNPNGTLVQPSGWYSTD